MKINLVPLFETLLDVKLKNASKMKDDQFAKVLQYDPVLYTLDDYSEETLINQKEHYSRWLIKMFTTGQLQNQNPERVRTLLKNFNIVKNRKNTLPSNDINGYKSIDELQSAVEQALENQTVNQKDKNARRQEKALKNINKEPGMFMDGATELLFSDDEWEVWIPHTFEGSKALGRGAGWCTAGSSDSHFNRYKEQGELYIIINKNDGEKRQLFVSEDGEDECEFKDHLNDVDKNFRKFIIEEPSLLQFFMTQEKVTDIFEELDNEEVAANSTTQDELWQEMEDNGIFEYYDQTNNTECVAYNGVSGGNWLLGRAMASDKYVSVADVIYYIEHGYFEEANGYGVDDFINLAISNWNIISEVDWDETELQQIYEVLSNKHPSEINNFESFLNCIFGIDEERNDFKTIKNVLTNYSDDIDETLERVPELLKNYSHYLLDKIFQDAAEVIHNYGNPKWVWHQDYGQICAILETGQSAPDFWHEHRLTIESMDETDILSTFGCELDLIDEYFEDDIDYTYFSSEAKSDIAYDIVNLFNISLDNETTIEESLQKQINNIIKLGKL